MSEPRKTKGQLDAQIGRIQKAYQTAVARTEYGSPEFRRQQGRWFKATEAHGKLRGDDRKIDAFKDYLPENRNYTSGAEVKRIEKHFGLDKRNVASLNALRNNVVDYYHKATENDRQKAWDMMPWMQSITAVIDRQISRKGGMV